MTVERLRKQLREHRCQRGWSYERLAAEIGADRITGQTVKRFIEGSHEPRELTLWLIEQYLKTHGVAA